MDTAMTAFLMTSAGEDDVNTPPPKPTSALYFEAMEPGFCLTSPPHRVDRSEQVEFAKI